MRGKYRNQQLIYKAVISKLPKIDENGDETGEFIETDVKGQSFRASVSLQDSPIEVSAGVVADYERMLTTYKHIDLQIGDRLYIDSTEKSDYVVTDIILTGKSLVFRYGIKKLV